MKLAIAAVFLLQAIALSPVSAAGKTIYCYYGSWAYLPQDKLEAVARQCTHLSYAFNGVNADGSLTYLTPSVEADLRNLNTLKSKTSFKLIIAIGGWNEWSDKYSRIAYNPATRSRFVQNLVNFALRNNLDGVDLDWEYPAQRDSAFPYADKENFTKLIAELYRELKKHGKSLYIAVAAPSGLASQSYNIREVAKNVDGINLMTYDLHGGWESVTGHHAVLYEAGANNVAASVEYWLQQGAPANKIILGVPFYGRSFRLQNPNNSGIGAPANGVGEGADGFLGYNQICTDRALNVKWDDAHQATYGVKGTNWVGFDNERSIQAKANFVHAKNLGGLMAWSVETDDVWGNCGPQFPLLRAIKQYL